MAGNFTINYLILYTGN